MSPRTKTMLALPLVALLAVAGSASAIYVVTPLQLHASTEHADVGDKVTFDIAPQNDTERAVWAGKTLSVRYAYDTSEGDETPEGETAPQERTLLETITLDDRAAASFDWTVPAEVDDHNVDVFLVSADGERVGFAYVAVGEAPPQMRILAGSGPAEAGGEEPLEQDGGAGDAPQAEAGNEVPGMGVVALLAGLGAAAFVAVRRH